MRGAVNMALDEALLESVQNGAQPLLRFYRWSPACLSFGRNQTARAFYDPDALAAAGIDVVRRPTGGLAVLHDEELTYSVVAPAALLGGPRSAYATINHAIVCGLRTLGVPAEIAGDHWRVTRPDAPGAAHPCFHSPAPGEVMAAGAKLVGSAQRCEKRVLLQHGSILMGGHQSAMRSFQNTGASAPDRDGITLEAVLGNAPDVTELVAAIVSGFESTLGTGLAPSGIAEAERDRADVIQKRYDSDDWTWRR